MKKHQKLLLFIVAIPFIYLSVIYNTLPDEVPIHWNAKGEIDDYGPKKFLWMIPFFLPLFTYLILEFVPLIDPRKNLNQEGSKYVMLKFWMVTILSGLAIYIIVAAQQGVGMKASFIFVVVGFVLLAVGNYLPSIKPNYFVGLRTPWTLENDEVWRKTHRLGGKVFVSLGVITIVLGLFTDFISIFPYYLGIIFIPMIYLIYYSYREYQHTK